MAGNVVEYRHVFEVVRRGEVYTCRYTKPVRRPARDEVRRLRELLKEREIRHAAAR